MGASLITLAAVNPCSSAAEYKKGLRTMREQLIESFPDSMIDDRIRIV